MASGEAGGTATAIASAIDREAKIEAPAKSAAALDLEFNLAVDVIYHRSRQAFLVWCHRVAMLGAIFFGSVAATDVVGARATAILAALCAALDLVMDFTGRAAAHGDAARELLAIVAELHRHKFDHSSCERAADEMFRVSTAEPAVFHVARDLAFDQAVTALGRDETRLVRVPFHRRWLAHVRRYEGRP